MAAARRLSPGSGRPLGSDQRRLSGCRTTATSIPDSAGRQRIPPAETRRTRATSGEKATQSGLATLPGYNLGANLERPLHVGRRDPVERNEADSPIAAAALQAA